jgi:hypothetical protein
MCEFNSIHTKEIGFQSKELGDIAVGNTHLTLPWGIEW